MITLQFSSAKGLSSKGIRFLTWSWASHVDFVLPDGKLFGALALENGGGVLVHEMHPRNHYHRVERYCVDAPASVLDLAMTQLGKPYDWEGIFGFFARNRKWEDKDKWFCSELVAWSFKQSGLPLINDESYRVTPRDLLTSTLLKPLNFNFEEQK